MYELDGIFWDASMDDLKNGFLSMDSCYLCLICGSTYQKGRIFSTSDGLVDARLAVTQHIIDSHGSVFDFLLNLNPAFTGITDIQKELLSLFHQGLSDTEIHRIKGGSLSTIRGHRFKLREKQRQARVFYTIMSLLDEKSSEDSQPADIHRGATMIDDRYQITEAETEKIIQTYFTRRDGALKLKEFPSREKRKIVVLRHLMNLFDSAKSYTEIEINSILREVYDDFATLRRYLVEYGFMTRNRDCSDYRVKG